LTAHWFATLALVLIVIGTALLLASWQEQLKHSNALHGTVERGESGVKTQSSHYPENALAAAVFG